MSSQITVKVSTQELKNASTAVKSGLDGLKKIFGELETTVNRTKSYWEGEAADQHRNKYTEQKDKIEEALARIAEQVTDLEQMAGIYEDAERSASQLSSSLPSDVIS